VPKNPFGMRLAIFDRCAKDCSLNRPQGAFRNLCPWGNQLVTASALPVLFFYVHSDSNLNLPTCGAQKSLRHTPCDF